MAFTGRLKRFFSIGKKNKNTSTKKREREQGAHSVSTPALSPIAEYAPDESGELAANQLLRSSSARYAVVREFDYNSLPPLPHPINHVLQTPASSTVSLASATTSLSSVASRGTYTVTIHRRTHHAHTEFPNANRSGDSEPPAQLLPGLRSDPSVASLLDLYDEHGRLPARAFSNSPPKGKEKSGGEGRAQVARNGSTLRQLLGGSVNSRSDAGTGEGDISWAERFLGETASPSSSTSSLGLPTPDTDSHLHDSPLPLDGDQSFGTHHDISASINSGPGISSLQVELSDGPETPPRAPSPVAQGRSPYGVQGLQTPQRASQVFGFLTNKRRPRAEAEADERSLPELPSVFSSPSDASGSSESADSPPPQRNRSRSHFSSDSSAEGIAPLPVTPTEDAFGGGETREEGKANEVQVLMAHGPTRVIVTAPTPSFHQDNTAAPARAPRGPRALHQRREPPTRDAFTALPPRRVSRRASSLESAGAGRVESAPAVGRHATADRMAERPGSRRDEAPASSSKSKEKTPARAGSKRRSILAVFEKENKHLSARAELPRTPIRTGTISRPYQMRPPVSPASSLELSAAGRELMVDLRQQRRGAREREQERRGRSYF
ncbi:hypothetical protein DFH07DRAFT_1058872 [Mycena maculata]|uniref:Uncharacterized protein n=1 Tax=Mycena maculata TaxID=230809 RepID=A0AAD7JIA6_9AGAR|nr:hypothetical protein DFH07DRAFT_1058872 [Mycena maculata]